MSEALEQRAVVEYCDLKKMPVSNIPNGDCRKQCLPCREMMRQAAQTLGDTPPKRLGTVSPVRCEEAAPI